jgi:hypothetical protein
MTDAHNPAEKTAEADEIARLKRECYGLAEHLDKVVSLAAKELETANALRARLSKYEAVAEACEPFTKLRFESFGQRTQGVGDYLANVWFPGGLSPVARVTILAAALAALKEPTP